ncbi:2315_t:CDS:2, partial [Acaulospora colombiana]
KSLNSESVHIKFNESMRKIEHGTAHINIVESMSDIRAADCDDETATITSEDLVESRNNDFDDIFDGELSDVDTYCSGCEESDYEDSPPSVPTPLVDVSHFVGFTRLNNKIIESLIYKLKEYKLYETMAILIKSDRLKIEPDEIPKKVKELIKREDVEGLKSVKEVFHKEAANVQKRTVHR